MSNYRDDDGLVLDAPPGTKITVSKSKETDDGETKSKEITIDATRQLFKAAQDADSAVRNYGSAHPYAQKMVKTYEDLKKASTA